MTYVVKSNEAKNLNLPGRISKELISSWNGSKNISLRLVTIDVQKEKQKVRAAHYHPNTEECIYVLDGEGITITEKKKYHLHNYHWNSEVMLSFFPSPFLYQLRV